jgi:hypothetical protein
LTRRGNDRTDKYPVIAKSIAALPVRNAYLDGELCGVLANVIGNRDIKEITAQDFPRGRFPLQQVEFRGHLLGAVVE